ncbi:MAG: hypothetical protein ACOX8G_09590 [Eubacterium sp.]|jgi:ribonuclease G
MKKQKLIITELNHAVTAHKPRILTALTEDGRLSEIYAEPTAQNLRIGSIYIGKVRKIVLNIQAAFVDIAPGVSTYLSLEHTEHCHRVRAQKAAGKIVPGMSFWYRFKKTQKAEKFPL